jgi:hypothetical protein
VNGEARRTQKLTFRRSEYFRKFVIMGVMRLLTHGFDCAKTQDIETTRVACRAVAENWEVHAHAEQSRLFLIVSNGSPGADG